MSIPLLLILFYPPLSFVLLISYFFYEISSKTGKIQFNKVLILLVVFAFASYGYGITSKPWLENDLYRYFDEIENFKILELLKILKSDKKFLYTRDILFYFVSRTDNIRFLPFIVAINIYGICGYVLYDYAKCSNLKFTKIEFMTLFMCTFCFINPTSLIANIRCVQAYTFVAFAVYREVIQKKKNIITVLFYFLALGLHVTTIFVILLRIVHKIFTRFGFLTVFVCFFFSQLITIAYNYHMYFGSLISNAILKAHFYFFEKPETESGMHEKISRLVAIYYMVSTIFVVFYHDHFYKKQKLLENKFISYLYSMMIFTLGALSISAGAYWRFEAIVVMFSVVYLIPLMKCKNWIIKIYLRGALLVASLSTLMNLMYISVYLDYSAMLEKSLSLTGVRILFDFCKGVYAF
ncbi:MAG: hypothetical protein IJP62_09945 [Treponema sp.]|nr:hypothetical protein [Treponema sp.]